jgi:hypothetical protein
MANEKKQSTEAASLHDHTIAIAIDAAQRHGKNSLSAASRFRASGRQSYFCVVDTEA